MAEGVDVAQAAEDPGRAGGSARSVLLTVLGDVVRPAGGTAWSGALQDLMESLGVAAPTTRQALRRLVADGTVTVERVGRRSRYAISPAAVPRLDEAAERIYRRRPPPWDGRWRLLTWTFEESERAARDALRRELGWLGFGPLGTSTYACPRERGERLTAVLDKHGAHGSVDVFTADYAGDDAELAARAFDLVALRELHADFLAAHPDDAPVPGDAIAALADRVALVHAWRRTLFLDPGLPAELLPDDALAGAAADRFHQRYAALERLGWGGWRRLADAADPDGPGPHVPSRSALVGA